MSRGNDTVAYRLDGCGRANTLAEGRRQECNSLKHCFAGQVPSKPSRGGSACTGPSKLLIAVLVLDESRREVGERLGLATDSGRKRVQRAVARLKKHLAKSLSRFARPDRFSHPQAP